MSAKITAYHQELAEKLERGVERAVSSANTTVSIHRRVRDVLEQGLASAGVVDPGQGVKAYLADQMSVDHNEITRLRKLHADLMGEYDVAVARLKTKIVNLQGAREIADGDECDVTASCSECGNINRYRSLAAEAIEKGESQ